MSPPAPSNARIPMLTDSSVCWKSSLKRIARRPNGNRRKSEPLQGGPETPRRPESPGCTRQDASASPGSRPPPRGLRLPDIPVSDHDAVGELPFQSLNLSPVGCAVKHLSPGTWVEADGRGPGTEDLPRHREVRIRLRAEARTDLHRDGNPRRVDGRLHDLSRKGGVGEKGRPGSSRRDLSDRAPHVDVDEVESEPPDLGGCFGHLLPDRPEQLRPDGALPLPVLEVPGRPCGLHEQPPGGDHLRDRHVGSVFPAKEAERSVRNPGEG